MKKLKFLSLIVATVLSSLIIYSCMKEDVVTQQPAILTEQLAQTTQTSNILELASTNKVINATKRPITTSNNLINYTNVFSSFGDEDCMTPVENGFCVTEQRTIVVPVPATTLNPHASTATVGFLQTTCFSADGKVASISFRQVDASPEPTSALFIFWLSLSSPTLEEAIDEYVKNAFSLAETIVMDEFFANNPNVDALQTTYFKQLCFINCIIQNGETFTLQKSTCGDKCCKRVKYFERVENGSMGLVRTGYQETGGSCSGDPQTPCSGPNVVKFTTICEHSCDGEISQDPQDH